MLVGGWGRLRMRYQIRTYPARPLCPFLAYFEELVQIIWQSDGSYAHRHTHTDRHTDAQTPWGSLQHIQSNGLNINKIAQVNVIIFNWQFIFIFLREIFVLSTKFCQIHYLRVRSGGNRHFTCPIQWKFKNLFFGGNFVIFSKTRLATTSKVINWFCWFSIANTGPSFTNMS